MMKIEEFIVRLNNLLEYEGDPSTKEILRKCYYPQQKREELEEKGDLLLTFIFNFDVTNFDVGGVHLNDISKIKEDQQYMYVGLYEGDDIVINKKDNKSIYIIVHEDGSSQKVASNSSRFLSNLLCIDKANLMGNLNDEEKMLLINNICEYKEAYSFYLTLIMYGF